MGIAILSIIVIIKPYAGIIIIPVLFYGVTLILIGVLSFIIYSKKQNTPKSEFNIRIYFHMLKCGYKSYRNNLF